MGRVRSHAVSMPGPVVCGQMIWSQSSCAASETDRQRDDQSSTTMPRLAASTGAISVSCAGVTIAPRSEVASVVMPSSAPRRSAWSSVVRVKVTSASLEPPNAVRVRERESRVAWAVRAADTRHNGEPSREQRQNRQAPALLTGGLISWLVFVPHTAQTTLPPICGVGYDPHRSLNACTRNRPRPLSASSPTSIKAGGWGLASQTSTTTFLLSDNSHRRTGSTCGMALAAASELVINSETTCSTGSVSGVSAHSQTIWRACRRAEGTAPGRAPNSRKSRTGHLPVMSVPRSWVGGTGTGAPLCPGLRANPGAADPETAPAPPWAVWAPPPRDRGADLVLVLPVINVPSVWAAGG